MSYKRRISNLLQKIQEAETAGAKTLAIAIIGKREDTGKWEVHADLWDGVKGSGSRWNVIPERKLRKLWRISMQLTPAREEKKLPVLWYSWIIWHGVNKGGGTFPLPFTGCIYTYTHTHTFKKSLGKTGFLYRSIFDYQWRGKTKANYT